MGGNNNVQLLNLCVFQYGVDQTGIALVATINEHIVTVTFHECCICLTNINEVYIECGIFGNCRFNNNRHSFRRLCLNYQRDGFRSLCFRSWCFGFRHLRFLTGFFGFGSLRLNLRWFSFRYRCFNHRRICRLCFCIIILWESMIRNDNSRCFIKKIISVKK